MPSCFEKKIVSHTKKYKMAVIFQDGRHFSSEILGKLGKSHALGDASMKCSGYIIMSSCFQRTRQPLKKSKLRPFSKMTAILVMKYSIVNRTYLYTSKYRYCAILCILFISDRQKMALIQNLFVFLCHQNVHYNLVQTDTMHFQAFYLNNKQVFSKP